jgi:hypothetical protein
MKPSYRINFDGFCGLINSSVLTDQKNLPTQGTGQVLQQRACDLKRSVKLGQGYALDALGFLGEPFD